MGCCIIGRTLYFVGLRRWCLGFQLPCTGGMLKFVDGAARWRLVEGALEGCFVTEMVLVYFRKKEKEKRDGVGLVMFSKHVGRMESNVAKVVAILEVLQIFIPSKFKLSWLWKVTL